MAELRVWDLELIMGEDEERYYMSEDSYVYAAYLIQFYLSPRIK